MDDIRRGRWIDRAVIATALAGTGLLAAAGTSASTHAVPAQTASANRAEADRIIAQAVADGFAGQVLAVVDGEVVLDQGYGFADAADTVPIDTSTVFAIGSVTKAFTRAAVLQLAEDGRLALSDPISRHLEDVPADKQNITIEDLVTMRAGLHEYHDDSGDHQAMTRDEALRRILDQRLRFEPGTEEAYSNSGYTLLAAIIENVSGQPYAEYVRAHLVEPAGMERTGFHGEDRWPDAQVARGRNGRFHGDNAPSHWPSPTWVLAGAGGMVANADDLLAWIRAVRAGKVLGQEALARFYPEDQPDRLYAGGDDFGFITMVMEVDHADDVVIVNTNTGYEVMDLAARVIEALRGEPVPFSLPEPDRDGIERETGGGGIPDSPRGRKAMALIEALEDGSDAALGTLVAEHFAAGLRNSFSLSEHLELLGRLSEIVRAASDMNVRPAAEWSLELRVVDAAGETSVFLVELADAPPHGIAGISRRQDALAGKAEVPHQVVPNER
jgi:CubicO group peptidase (beta-lactamase class C family)